MNKIKRNLTIGLGIMLLLMSVTWIACKKTAESPSETQTIEAQAVEEKKILYYTCGMHPSVKVTPEDFAAGNISCPICKMDLIPVYAEESMPMEGGHLAADDLESQLRLSPRAQALAQVRTEEISFRRLLKEINTVGNLVFDERKVAVVSAWIPGRLDKLYVDFTGVKVRKGNPLARIYSPDLLTTQEEYLLARETQEKVRNSSHPETIKGAENLVQAAKKRLLLWGISEDQIAELDNTRTASTHMILHAALSGTVIEKNALEGKYVKEGEPLFRIADLSNLWMEADIYEYELSFIKKGQDVTITTPSYPGETFQGKISFIEPIVSPETRSIKARVDVPNPEQKLKPGMYVNARIDSMVHNGIRAPEKTMFICPMHPEVRSGTPGDCPECGMVLEKQEAFPKGSVLAVPKAAVLDTGVRKIVYIEHEPGVYIAKEVELGAEAVADVNGKKRKFYAVLSGLSEKMKVVSRGNFLIDSQRQITGQAEAIYSGALDKAEEKKPPVKHIH